ncbi:unnamed protein product [Sphagnum balticum]
MESIRNSYAYQRIDLERKEIRLLELLPGEREDKVRVRLRHASLDAEPRYDALSYMWGDPSVTRSIQLDDSNKFQVTVNLENALRDLRLIDRSMILWVNAVCINQGDIEERNHQVQLMQAIYQGASVVRAWLDIEIDPECPAFARFARLDQESTEDELSNNVEFWEPVTRISKDPY